MNKNLISAVGVFATTLALSVQADTQQVSSISHWVQMDPGVAVEMPNGAKGRATVRSHATVIREDGSLASQWCTGHQGVGPSGEPGGAGYCTLFDDTGDMLYVSYMLGSEEQGGSWTVMGGTGQYAGATGGGTTSMVSARADGQAWTSRSSGTVTMK